MLRVIGRNEPLARRRVGHIIAGRHDVGALSAQHSQNAFSVAGPGCAHKSTCGLLGGLKRLLGAGDGCHCENEHHHDQRGQSCQARGAMGFGKGEKRDHDILGRI